MKKVELSKLDFEKDKMRVQLMCAMLSNPVIVESEKNFSVHGDDMLLLMRKYALEIVEDLTADSDRFFIN
jgi:hypothetical protein